MCSSAARISGRSVASGAFLRRTRSSTALAKVPQPQSVKYPPMPPGMPAMTESISSFVRITQLSIVYSLRMRFAELRRYRLDAVFAQQLVNVMHRRQRLGIGRTYKHHPEHHAKAALHQFAVG